MLVIVILQIFGLNTYAEDNIKVCVLKNSYEEKMIENNAIILNNRTMVPIRVVLEKLGYNVNWNGSNMSVTATGAEGILTMTIGKTDMYRNNKLIYCDVAPTIINNKTYLPARGISRLINYGIRWDGSSKKVTLIPNVLEGVDEILDFRLSKRKQKLSTG